MTQTNCSHNHDKEMCRECAPAVYAQLDASHQTSGTETKWEENPNWDKEAFLEWRQGTLMSWVREQVTKAREETIKEIQNEIFPQGLDDPEIDMASYAWIVHIFQALKKPQ